MTTIKLDKERKLCFDLNAMAEFEEVTGKSIFQTLEQMTAKDLRALLWACLIDEDPTLTIKDVGRMVTPDKIEEINKSISEAVKQAMPEPSSEPGE